MIKLFGITDKTFNTNGDKVIIPLKAKVVKKDNGDFYLDLETALKYVEDLTEGRILIAPTPQGEQPFRVGNVKKTKNKLTAKCWHVFYDSENYLIEDSFVVDKNCNDALDHLNSATEPASPFTTLSDVQTVESFRCVRQSFYQAIQTVIERWGGHLVRDGFLIQIRNTIGRDNGVTVRYAKNLKDITCQENWDGVVTKLLPVGSDGLMLEEVYLESEIQYEIPYTKTVSFQQNLNKDEYASEEEYNQALIEDLRSQATNYLSTNCYPQISYTLSADLERLTDVGDTVQVIDERLGINIITNVTAFEYDCVLKRYTKVEFGTAPKTLSNLTSNIVKETEKTLLDGTQLIQLFLEQELTNATSEIWEMLGSSYVIYQGDKILVVDSLPAESARNVMMINSGGIGFSQNGINGTFTSAWTLDGTLNMQAINVINLVADMIKGGTLKLGSNSNSYGRLEVYDVGNTLIAELDKDGLKVNGQDGSYVRLNNEVGFAGYDKNDNKIYWVDRDEFHMKKGVMEEEITLCNKLRFIPITITDDNNNVVNDGIGLISTATGGGA